MVVLRGATDEGSKPRRAGDARGIGTDDGTGHGHGHRTEMVALVLALVRRLVMPMPQVRDFRTTLIVGTVCSRR